MATLNEVFSTLAVRRRYEVWFLRLGLADGSGAWWFRYLLMNPGREGCAGNARGMPVQVWATWFPLNGRPLSLIQGFPLDTLELSRRGRSPFYFGVNGNGIEEDRCRGALDVDGHNVSWDLQYRSTFRVTLSDKGWIGFSRSTHSDALFSGEIRLDNRTFSNDPLGFGVQGHNCGYRHRSFWRWTHAYFPRDGRPASTFEALVYDMPLGLVFRKAVLWHEGSQHIFRSLRETDLSESMQWNFHCSDRAGWRLDVAIDGRGPSMHRLPYVKTNCSGSFEVRNNSLASAQVLIQSPGKPALKLETNTGAVLEMVG
ncbi:MAG TPA: hypothetical protein VKQ11_01565 [Candidatus Sulfotelmatobacter sp.]|nr:hypothetical protein [Candidatus Sulfotelmatobacter sp.]